VYFSYNKLFCTLFLLQKNDIIKNRQEERIKWIFQRKVGTYLKKLLPKWQETYMERLIKEYISLLNEEKLASEKFWELEKRINKDKRSPGVIVPYRKSDVMMILLKLINDSVITFDDLDEFSDNIKGSLKFITGADQAYQEQGDVTK
jgi:hypothetical protein